MYGSHPNARRVMWFEKLLLAALLLADIFENFHNSYITSYRFDLAHYYSLPSFTWDAMLKHTRIRFELFTDIDLVVFIERDMKRPQSMFRHAKTYAQNNNKYMHSYDPSNSSSYLMWIIFTDHGRCVNLCHTSNFDESKTLRNSTSVRSVRIRPPVFSRSISNIRSIYTTDTLIYHFAQRAISVYIRTYIYTYVHAYIHIYVYTYFIAYILMTLITLMMNTLVTLLLFP